MKKIESFEEVIYRFNYFFFDVFGTIINNKQDSKSINKIFSKIKIIGNTKIIIVSNSSRSSDQIKKLLKRKKINVKLIDKVFTSSEVASKFLLKNSQFFNKKFYFSGSNKYLFYKLKKKKFYFTQNISNADYLILANKTNETKNILKNINNKIKIILINSDLYDIKNNKLLGYYLNKYFKINKNLINLGKPNLYDYIIKKIPLNKKIIIIGDSLLHDFSNLNERNIKTLHIKNNIINKSNLNSDIFKKNKKKNNYKIDKLVI